MEFLVVSCLLEQLVVNVSITQTIVHLFVRHSLQFRRRWVDFPPLTWFSYCQGFLSIDHNWRTKPIGTTKFSFSLIWLKYLSWNAWYVSLHTHWQACTKNMNICKVIRIWCQFCSWICLTICQFVSKLWGIKPEIISVIRSTHVFYQLQILQLILTPMSLEELVFVLND